MAARLFGLARETVTRPVFEGPACVGLVFMVLAGWGLCTIAEAQTLTPPPGATYGQPLPVPPVRPLYYSPFTNYDLLYGYSRGALTAPQPIGHEHIPTGPNGYIYRPVYSTPVPPPAALARPTMAGAARGPQSAAAGSAPAANSILRRLPEAPPPAPESVVQPQAGRPLGGKSGKAAGPREF